MLQKIDEMKCNLQKTSTKIGLSSTLSLKITSFLTLYIINILRNNFMLNLHTTMEKQLQIIVVWKNPCATSRYTEKPNDFNIRSGKTKRLLLCKSKIITYYLRFRTIMSGQRFSFLSHFQFNHISTPPHPKQVSIYMICRIKAKDLDSDVLRKDLSPLFPA